MNRILSGISNFFSYLSFIFFPQFFFFLLCFDWRRFWQRSSLLCKSFLFFFLSLESWSSWGFSFNIAHLYKLVCSFLHIVLTISKNIQKKILLNSWEHTLQIPEFHFWRRVRLRETSE